MNPDGKGRGGDGGGQRSIAIDTAAQDGQVDALQVGGRG
jgi:hypothetical protein